jgi:hypothetical protein
MKQANWLTLDLHEWVRIDFEDGRRIELAEGDGLLFAWDSVMVKTSDGVDYIYPMTKVAQIIKKYKKQYQTTVFV